ncbi:MAG: hypothetical protein KF774_14455 [Planctomyces sp.]|nr:hypothetical protein [Planctomyces sp.]
MKLADALRRMAGLPISLAAVVGLSLALLSLAPRPVAAQEATAEGDEADPDALTPESITLPRLQDLEPPTLEALLNGMPLDWVVLSSGEVVISEPVTPRPDTLNKLELAFREKEKERRGKTGAAFEQWKREFEDLRFLYVNMPGPPAQEFRIARVKVSQIIYHEDHILSRIDALLAEGNIETANELLVRFERQWPDWPGLPERRQALLLTDARLRLSQGSPESALVLCEELHVQNPEFPGLSELAGQAAEQLILAAQMASDPLQARHFLMRLNRMFANHPVFTRLSASYAARATELMNQSAAATRNGDHPLAATLAEEAVQVWPPLVNLRPGHKAATERYQRLRVGVVRLPGSPKATPFDGEAELRGRRLSDHRLFEVDSFRGGIPHYRTSYLDEWEPFDLGRRMRFTLTQTRQPWEAQPPLDASVLGDVLLSQLDPASVDFDERLSAYIRTVTVESPFEFSLTFSRVPARVEPILRNATARRSSRPIEGQPAVADSPDADVEGLQPVAFESTATAELLSGGFPVVSSEEGRTVYRRLRLEPDGLPQYHVTEVIEQLYDSHERAYQALLQGDVWMLPDLPDWIVRRAQANRALEKDFFIQKYSAPTTHVLQFNPRSRALGFRELRRALMQAIDRERLLFDVVLRDPGLLADSQRLQTLRAERGAGDADVLALSASLRDRRQLSHGRIVNSPFPSFSYANSPQLTPRNHDLSAALALTLAVTAQMGGELPPLRMAVPPEAIPQLVAERLLAAWKRVGIEVVLVEPDSAEAAGWDIAYRTLQMEEPIVDLWPFLTVQDRANIQDLEMFPDWLQQGLVALDRTSDWNRAVDQLQTLHRQLWADVRFIPLWEVDGYLLYRKQVRGVPTNPLHSYDRLDRWHLEAWYAADAP